MLFCQIKHRTGNYSVKMFQVFYTILREQFVIEKYAVNSLPNRKKDVLKISSMMIICKFMFRHHLYSFQRLTLSSIFFP